MITRESLSSGKTGVYAIRNLFDGKVYIGSSSQCIRRRWSKHLSALARGDHHNFRLNIAWARGGVNSLEFSVLELCQSEKTIECEQRWMDELKPEYNIAKKANATAPWTDKMKAAHSLAHTGYRHSEETKNKMRIARGQRGPMPQWMRDNMSAIRIGKPKPWAPGRIMTDEIKQKISKSRKGKRIPREAIERIRLANTGKKRTPEFCELMRKNALGNQNRKGIPWTDEMKQKLSKSQTAKWASGTRKPR